jgi:catechol 2,3-dioxygenase-like lactoylglutathione lyase family enzyme
MPILAIDHVQLAAPPGCEPRARWFFGDLLGLREIEKPAALRGRGGVWFAVAGQQQLHIGVDPAFTPARKAHPAFKLDPDELAATAQRLMSAGVEIVWDESIPGIRRFHVHDPWGNRIELMT